MNIKKCDRCGKTIEKNTDYTSLKCYNAKNSILDNNYLSCDLCEDCAESLNSFLNGKHLEEYKEDATCKLCLAEESEGTNDKMLDQKTINALKHLRGICVSHDCSNCPLQEIIDCKLEVADAPDRWAIPEE